MITSVQNNLIKQVVGLRDVKERRASGLSLIDGVREIERALSSAVLIKQVLYCRKMFSTHHEEDALVQVMKAKIETIEVDERVFAKIAFGERGEGLLAVIQTPQLDLAQLKLSKNPLVVVLESVEKPGNLGAILRSCDGAGVDAVLVCDPKTDIYNPNVIRASTGIVFTLPVVADSTTHIIQFLKQHGITSFAATPHAQCNFTQANFKQPTALVLGSEDKGLSEAWISQANQQIVIPMLGKADSLNVSVTCALLVYEALRQRQ